MPSGSSKRASPARACRRAWPRSGAIRAASTSPPHAVWRCAPKLAASWGLAFAPGRRTGPDYSADPMARGAATAGQPPTIFSAGIGRPPGDSTLERNRRGQPALPMWSGTMNDAPSLSLKPATRRILALSLPVSVDRPDPAPEPTVPRGVGRLALLLPPICTPRRRRQGEERACVWSLSMRRPNDSGSLAAWRWPMPAP